MPTPTLHIAVIEWDSAHDPTVYVRDSAARANRRALTALIDAGPGGEHDDFVADNPPPGPAAEDDEIRAYLAEYHAAVSQPTVTFYTQPLTAPSVPIGDQADLDTTRLLLADDAASGPAAAGGRDTREAPQAS